MASNAAESAHPVRVAADIIDNRRNGEEHAAEHMQGWHSLRTHR